LAVAQDAEFVLNLTVPEAIRLVEALMRKAAEVVLAGNRPSGDSSSLPAGYP
jgi:hypothetical protein